MSSGCSSHQFRIHRRSSFQQSPAYEHVRWTKVVRVAVACVRIPISNERCSFSMHGLDCWEHSVAADRACRQRSARSPLWLTSLFPSDTVRRTETDFDGISKAASTECPLWVKKRHQPRADLS